MSEMQGGLNRRNFLQGAAGLGAVLAAPAVMAKAETGTGAANVITGLSASQLSAAIRQRELGCVEVMTAYLDRIDRLNPTYNAIVSLRDRGELLAEARQADEELARGQYRGWMHGMPHAIKDLSDAKGLLTSYGSPLFTDNIATGDDLFVSRIRQAGAIFIGKTNAPEFGLGSHSYNPVFGTTCNAYNPALTAGGSSGGAAVVLATQMLPVADGSDMMGSLRNPAAFNNIIGFRPSRGRVAEYPSGDVFYQQLPVSGPMGRNVEDTIRLLNTMAGYDPRDPGSLRDHIPDRESFTPARLDDYRVGWMGDYQGYLTTEPGVLTLCETALSALEAQGVVVEPCMPDYSMASLWDTWITLRSWALQGLKPFYDKPESRALLKPEVVWEIERGMQVGAADVSRAGVERTNWYRALLKLFDRYDVLALPTAQVYPFDAQQHWPKAINGRSMDTYHRWMEVVIGGTLAGLPVVSLPAGFNDAGLPMGMQFIGRYGEDQQVLEFALSYEQVTSYLDRRPSL